MFLATCIHLVINAQLIRDTCTSLFLRRKYALTGNKNSRGSQNKCCLTHVILEFTWSDWLCNIFVSRRRFSRKIYFDYPHCRTSLISHIVNIRFSWLLIFWCENRNWKKSKTYCIIYIQYGHVGQIELRSCNWQCHIHIVCNRKQVFVTGNNFS